jgi:toxin ParE2
MRIEFVQAAEDEAFEAAVHYERKKRGLGAAFFEELNQSLNRIVCFPNAWAPLSARTRRCRFRRFPYGVIYQVRDELILVIAVMHMSREPDSWRQRLDDDL